MQKHANHAADSGASAVNAAVSSAEAALKSSYASCSRRCRRKRSLVLKQPLTAFSCVCTDMKAAASPKRHGVSQPVIKIAATSSTISSLNGPTIMYSFNETRGAPRHMIILFNIKLLEANEHDWEQRRVEIKHAVRVADCRRCCKSDGSRDSRDDLGNACCTI